MQPPPYIARAAVGAVRAALDHHGHTNAAVVIETLWPGDRVSPLALRSASAPATTGSAAVLGQQALGSFLNSLASLGAAAKLFADAPKVALGANATVALPTRASAVSDVDAAWVEEAQPASVKQYTTAAGVVLGPVKKLVSITSVTRELSEASDFEAIIDTILREAVSYILDASVFSNTAASAARPAGILVGISPLSATAAGVAPDVMMADLALLAQAVAPVGAGLTYVMNPKQAAAVRLYRGALWSPDVPILASIAVPDRTVIALDPQCLVSSFSDVRVTASRQATLHFEGVNPLQIASGSTIASPTIDLFSQDLVALKVTLNAAWAVRAPAISWMAGVNW